MNILIIFIILLIGLLAFFFFKNRKKPQEQSSFADLISNEEEYNNTTVDTEDFSKKYFDALQNGEKSQQFLVIGSQQDTSLIRSLLAADDIPTYTENENINKMYGGGATIAASAFAIKLFILTKDYDKAYEIVCDYAKSKSQESQHQTQDSSGKTVVAAAITGLFFSPFPVNSEQKGMGITILPKVSE